MDREPEPVQVQDISHDDLQRIDRLFRRIGGVNVVWGAGDVLNVWLTEKRMELDRESARRLERATWYLAVFTFGLFVATIGLIATTITAG